MHRRVSPCRVTHLGTVYYAHMSDELFLEGKNYISSKQAALATGYAQDYIGQLARGGLINAQRVGGLWYVSLESLTAYQKNADEYKPMVPAPKQASDIDSIVSFDGKDYISASRASKLTTYNQDYIGQLARGGKILSRQIGNRWYIEREGLFAHKAQKDSLLAAVQSEAAGLAIQKHHASPVATPHVQLLNYTEEKHDLMPSLEKKPDPIQEEVRKEYNIPIRVVQAPSRLPAHVAPRALTSYVAPSKRSSDMTISKAMGAAVALTFVIVLSYGFTTLKDDSTYALKIDLGSSAITNNAFTAGAAVAADKIIDAIENIVSPEIVYKRSNE